MGVTFAYSEERLSGVTPMGPKSISLWSRPELEAAFMEEISLCIQTRMVTNDPFSQRMAQRLPD